MLADILFGVGIDIYPKREFKRVSHLPFQLVSQLPSQSASAHEGTPVCLYVCRNIQTVHQEHGGARVWYCSSAHYTCDPYASVECIESR